MNLEDIEAELVRFLAGKGIVRPSSVLGKDFIGDSTTKERFYGLISLADKGKLKLHDGHLIEYPG